MYKKQSFTVIICVVILVIIGFLGYRILESRYKKELDATLEQEKVEWQGKNEKLRNKIDSLEKTISNLSGDTDLVNEEGMEPTDGPGLVESASDSEYSDSIEDVERRIASFFVYLDKQEYIKKYKLNGSIYNVYEDAVQKLSKKIPLLTNETESLYNIFLNIAHFYRVLGSDRLSLFKDILSHEEENIEPTMRDFYIWYSHDEKDNKRIKGRPSPDVLYDYAGFFLNTIGGRNYLMRRDSKVRILMNYYCVLILDRANDMKQNPNGIDIRPYLRLVISDISDKSGFIFHSEYMKNLRMLMIKYSID